jgi:hypothetical protein
VSDDPIRAARVAKRSAKRRRREQEPTEPPTGPLVSQGGRSELPRSRRQASPDDAIRAAYHELSGRRVIRLDL